MNRVLPFAVDIALVLVFAIIGRASHGEALSVSGIFGTFWPFAVALVVGWVVVVLLGKHGTGVREATIVWLVTLVGGMGLRVTAGGGAPVAFLVVAALFLALFLGGWRVVAFLVRRRRRVAA